MSEQSIEDKVNDLISLGQEGKWEVAYEKYYHNDLEKADLDGILVKGKAQNIEVGRAFASKITNVRDFSCAGKVVKGNRSFIVWSLDIDVDGSPFPVVETAIQDWEDGRIVRERFFV